MLNFAVYTHVIAGVIALVVAPVAIAMKKGSRQHVRWGRIFFWSMTYVFVTAVILSIVKWIPFLLMIAFFSYYSIITAYRSVHQKQIHKGLGVTWFDWFILALAGVFNVSFVGYGAYQVFNGTVALGVLAIGFGGGGCLQAFSQFRTFTKPPNDKMHWFFSHGGNMLGGYIAAVTAFSTQTMHFLPDFLQWTWPSLLGVPLIAITMRYYRVKLRGGNTGSALVEWRS